MGFPSSQNSTANNPLDLPAKCFVSHSYKDETARAHLLDALPALVEPFIFPAIDASPDQMVSNELVSSILSCPGLIYLEGGASAASFWVAFERDYALRAGKRVYAFNPSTRTLRRDTAEPMDLAVFPSYARLDEGIVDRVLSFMQDQRSFDLGASARSDPQIAQDLGDYFGKLSGEIVGALQRNGNAVVFWSANAARSEWVADEIDRAFDYQLNLMREDSLLDPAHRTHVAERRILFATLDETPLPATPAMAAYARVLQNYQRDGHVEDALVPVHLTDAHGDLDLHRVDDLIVRAYWLIYRHSQHSSLT